MLNYRYEVDDDDDDDDELQNCTHRLGHETST